LIRVLSIVQLTDRIFLLMCVLRTCCG